MNTWQHQFFKRRLLLICVGLALTTLTAFWQVRECAFVNYDDDMLVTNNQWVKNGLTWQSMVWAFTDSSCDWWHPLTWLSHMLDCQLYGLNAGPHHLTNLMFHIVNTLLLFGIFARMTGGIWQSAFVAALFGLHPLHVESVAWIAERKDVLSGLFWMLSLWAYLHYVKRPNYRRYLLMVVVLVLGLMAKPMLITLPFVLILLDYWPLRRFADGLFNRGNLRFFVEKLPLISLCFASTALTYIGQRRIGGLASASELPMYIRLANAFVAYVAYLAKTVWPVRLAVFYPYPTEFPASQVIFCAGILLGITVFAIRSARGRPYLIVGWLWYLGTLVPVIGLVQVSDRAMADRFTYIPLVGIFVMLAWGVGEWAARLRIAPRALGAAAVVAISLCAVATWAQVRHWRSSITLFEHAVAVTTDNAIAQENLGVALVAEGKPEEAIKHYRENLRINPRDQRAHYNLGVALTQLGRSQDAMTHYIEALRINPEFVEAHHNLAVVLAHEGRLAEAVAHYEKALHLKPELADAHYNLANALRRQGNLHTAVIHYLEAIRLNPDYVEAHVNLGFALAQQAKLDEAVQHWETALRLDPGNQNAQRGIEQVRGIRSSNTATP